MSELSPAARAVFESFNSQFDWVEDGVPGPQFKGIAAALRAAVDQLTFRDSLAGDVINPRELLALADELEAL